MSKRSKWDMHYKFAIYLAILESLPLLMNSKQTMFFATITDIKSILKSLEELFVIQYFKTGLFDSKDIPKYSSIFSISDLGYAKHGDWNYIDDYLIIPGGASVNIRKVNQRKGGVKYAVDQMENPQSIVIKIGGIYTEKNNVLVAGRIGTISEDRFSTEIYKIASSKIKKEFNRIDTFYVGKEAEEKLLTGWRLVTNEKLPKEYDLVLG